MGSKKDCDDGKSNLTMDLGDMEEATTCYTGVGEMFYLDMSTFFILGKNGKKI